MAARNGHKKAIEVLLAKGADVRAVDKYGKRAIAYAKGADIKALLKLASK